MNVSLFVSRGVLVTEYTLQRHLLVLSHTTGYDSARNLHLPRQTFTQLLIAD